MSSSGHALQLDPKVRKNYNPIFDWDNQGLQHNTEGNLAHPNIDAEVLKSVQPAISTLDYDDAKPAHASYHLAHEFPRTYFGLSKYHGAADKINKSRRSVWARGRAQRIQ
jgi:hypothetical protein